VSVDGWSYAPVSRDKSTDRTALGSLLVAYKVVIGLFALGSTDRVGAARLQPSFGRISAARRRRSLRARHTGTLGHWSAPPVRDPTSARGTQDGRGPFNRGTRFHWRSVLDRVRSEHRCKPASTDSTREKAKETAAFASLMGAALSSQAYAATLFGLVCFGVQFWRAVVLPQLRMLPWWRGRSDVE
jgi:hypothetical protein